MSDDIGDPTGERTVSKLSEIRARPACICSWNPPSEKDYLLNLVKRLGKALLRFADGPFCEYCSITFENNGSITHEDKCPVPQARALLLEIKE